MYETVESILARLLNFAPWNVYRFNTITKECEPHLEIASGVLYDVVIQEGNLREQVQTVSGQIAHWGRLLAQCERVWQATEHKYRVWRDGKSLDLTNPEDKPDDWKKPTQGQVDRLIRVDPEYTEWYIKQERAQEAYNATKAVYEAFKAKKDMLKAALIRSKEDSSPTWGI